MYKIPRFINKPMMFTIFEMDEVMLIYLVVMFSYMAKSYLLFFVLIVSSYFLIKKKKEYPQGYLKHVLFFLSLQKIEGYPEYTTQEFIE